MANKVREFTYLRTKGAIRSEERRALRRLSELVVSEFEEPVVVNIGVEHGASMHALYTDKARIIGIDIDLSPIISNRDKLKGVEFIEADSGSYQFEGDVHLLFVDGSHEYEGVRADIDNWTPYIPVGGIIAFHDYAPAVGTHEARLKQVRQAVDDWINDNWEKVEEVSSLVAFRRLA